MASNTINIHKLQQALNSKGYRILYQTSQFYSAKMDRPITLYHIKQAQYDEVKGKFNNVELFKSTSQIQIVLFLRDLWCEATGQEIPTDNEMWNSIKEKYFGKEKEN